MATKSWELLEAAEFQDQTKHYKEHNGHECEPGIICSGPQR